MKDAILGVIRHLLTSIGGGLVAGGLATQDDLTTAIAAVMTLIGFAWSLWDKKSRQQSDASA